MSLPELDRNRNDMRILLDSLHDELTTQGVDMNTPLVSPDGFPRADIDIVRIRQVRNQIARLRNDYEKINQEIEREVYKAFESGQNPFKEVAYGNGHVGKVSGPRTFTSGSTTQLETLPAAPLPVPFATVRSVSEGSPAHSAGLQVNDQIYEFGRVNAGNHDNLRAVARTVGASLNSEIVVKAVRDGQELSLTLVPTTWPGPGTLGCLIVPV